MAGSNAAPIRRQPPRRCKKRQPQPCIFRKLPQELRLKIWKLIVIQEAAGAGTEYEFDWENHFVCYGCQNYMETTPQYYGENNNGAIGENGHDHDLYEEEDGSDGNDTDESLLDEDSDYYDEDFEDEFDGMSDVFREPPEDYTENRIPGIVAALRGHKDRELYFEALEQYYQHTTFRLHYGNVYGQKIAPKFLRKFNYIEYELGVHFHQCICRRAPLDFYYRPLLEPQPGWEPVGHYMRNTKHITVIFKSDLCGFPEDVLLILEGLCYFHKVIIKRDDGSGEDGDINMYNDALYSGEHNVTGKLATVSPKNINERLMFATEEWLFENEDHSHINVDLSNVVEILETQHRRVSNLALWLYELIEHDLGLSPE